MRPFISFVLATLTLCSPAQEARNSGITGGQESKEYVRISEILINTPQPYHAGQVADAERQAKQILGLIQQGENFADLAKTHSQGPSATAGGDVGYFSRGQLTSSIDAVAFQTKVGDVSGIIRTKQGFLILKITDHRWGQPGVSPTDLLSSTRVTPELAEYLNGLKADVKRKWYDSIPIVAENKKGEVIIELVVNRDGAIRSAKIAASSGDADLDRAAMTGVGKVHSLPSLPKSVAEDLLSLRLRFKYNLGNDSVY